MYIYISFRSPPLCIFTCFRLSSSFFKRPLIQLIKALVITTCCMIVTVFARHEPAGLEMK